MGQPIEMSRGHERERGRIVEPEEGTHVLTDEVDVLRLIGRVSQQGRYAVLANIARGLGGFGFWGDC